MNDSLQEYSDTRDMLRKRVEYQRLIEPIIQERVKLWNLFRTVVIMGPEGEIRHDWVNETAQKADEACEEMIDQTAKWVFGKYEGFTDV